MKIKIIAIFLSLLLIVLTGCNDKEITASQDKPSVNIENEVSSRDYMTLLYSASDTFNPYTAVTETNRQLCKLLYDSLIRLDNEFNVSYSLAENIELTGTVCKVKIKSTVFSDGSPLTAGDVVYSFNLAKASNTEFAHKLYSVASVSATGNREVTFNLTKADPYFENSLDFPVIKTGSEKRTDSDSVVLPPIGSGRYMLNEKLTGLILNTKSNADANSYALKKINLINTPDNESLSHYIEVGAADMYYSDISDGNIQRMSGEKVSININHLVYIGVNSLFGDLAKTELRQAISSSIDRATICRDGYYNNALPATGFFNPVWKPVKSLQNIEIASNKAITIENLEKIGYNSVDNAGIRKNKTGTKLNFSLLVNKENTLRTAVAKLIAAQLLNSGIKVRVVEKSYAEYIADLTAGNFELYLAEVYITPNMDFSSLVTYGGTAAYGFKNPNEEKTEDTSASVNETASKTDTAEPVEEKPIATSAEIIEGLYSGKNTIADVASVLQTEMPLIPICYRTGILFYNEKMKNVNNSSASDIYFSIGDFKFK